MLRVCNGGTSRHAGGIARETPRAVNRCHDPPELRALAAGATPVAMIATSATALTSDNHRRGRFTFVIQLTTESARAKVPEAEASGANYSESVSLRRPERDFHTRFGWWIMTHPRGGALVIGLAAAVLLAIDVGYIAQGWRSLDSPLHRGYLVGIIGMLVLNVASDRLGVAEPLGTNRPLARLRARRITKVLGPIPFVAVAAAVAFGLRFTAGFILGQLVFLAGTFLVSVAKEIAHPHTRT
jgi:hypothetical protein